MTGTPTPRQEEVLRAIRNHIREEDQVPTLDELAATMGISKITVLEHLRRLETKGIISREPRTARSIRLLAERCLHCRGTGHIISSNAGQPPSNV